MDQLLHDIDPDLSGKTTKMSSSSDGSNKDISILSELGIEEDSIQSRLDEASHKKQHLNMELDNLLGQVKQLHSGFLGLKDGNRVSPLQHNILYTGRGHERTGSLDIMATPPSPPGGYLTLPLPGHRLSVVW